MLTLSRWKIVLVTLSVIFGILFTLPNLLPQKTLDSFPGWLPKQKLNLGRSKASGMAAGGDQSQVSQCIGGEQLLQRRLQQRFACREVQVMQHALLLLREARAHVL